MKNKAYIRGLGFYVPEKVLTNADLESMVDTTDEWITSRTGIKQRHIAAPGQPTSHLALASAKKALADADIHGTELSHILVATLTPDAYCGNTASLLQRELGAEGAMSMDVNAACSGFLYGMQTARGLLCLDPEAKVLLSAAEVLSSRTNFSDRGTCVLFGDGAGSAILASEPGPGALEILDLVLGSDGNHWDMLTIKGGGSARPLAHGEPTGDDFFIQMAGREVFKVATRTMIDVSRQILAKNDLTVDDVDLLITHQANFRIIDYVGKKLELPPEKVFVNVDKYGNTSAASVGIALTEAVAQGRAKPGDLVMLTTFGGGFTWGSALLRVLPA